MLMSSVATLLQATKVHVEIEHLCLGDIRG
jgi:hypothetical protein